MPAPDSLVEAVKKSMAPPDGLVAPAADGSSGQEALDAGARLQADAIHSYVQGELQKLITILARPGAFVAPEAAGPCTPGQSITELVR